jgi:hypothetical protein
LRVGVKRKTEMGKGYKHSDQKKQTRPRRIVTQPRGYDYTINSYI